MIAAEDLQRFKGLLSEKNSFLVVLPQEPDLDAVASGSSLYLALRGQGKDAQMVCPTPMRVEANRVVGVDKVGQEVGDKNLNISFEGYDAANIEKVSYDIDNGRFNLRVVPKPGFVAPTPDQVKIDYAGQAAEAVIVVKAETRQSLGKFATNDSLFGQNPVVLVSNIPAQGFQGAIEVINPAAAATAEVVYQIMESFGWQADVDIAGNLFLGLREGTNNFQNQNVSAETFEIAGKLVQRGARVQASVFEAQSPAVRQGPSTPPQDWLEPKVYKGSKLP